MTYLTVFCPQPDSGCFNGYLQMQFDVQCNYRKHTQKVQKSKTLHGRQA